MIFGNKHKQEIEKLKRRVELLSAKQTVMELEERLRDQESPEEKAIRVRKEVQFLIVNEAVCWLRDNLEGKRCKGLLSWQIQRDFQEHMINYVEDINKPIKCSRMYESDI